MMILIVRSLLRRTRLAGHINGALDQSVKSNQHYGIIFGAYRERTSQSAMFTVAQYTEYIFVL